MNLRDDDMLILTIDRKDYDPEGNRVKRISVRGIIEYGDKYALIYCKQYGDYIFPGGGRNEGEELEDTLIREVREESGLTVIPDSIRYFGWVKEVFKGKYEDIFEMVSHYYYCNVEDEIGKQSLEEYEEEYGYELSFVSLNEALENNEMNMKAKNITWTDRDTIVMKRIVDSELKG